jgi:hypothetical protein
VPRCFSLPDPIQILPGVGACFQRLENRRPLFWERARRAAVHIGYFNAYAPISFLMLDVFASFASGRSPLLLS